MSRSSVIWVVMKPGRHLPRATFTVKHEMVTWMKRNEPDPSKVEVFKMGDGTWQVEPVPYDPITLKPIRVIDVE